MTNLDTTISNIKANPLGIVLQIREYLLNFCKIISIVLFSYYIIKVQEYEITWTLFATYFPTTISNINALFTFFGTTLLILPLSLIITSFFNENRILHLIATWFSFAGSLFAVFFGIFNRTLLDNINLKFFKITHILTLQDKQAMFIEKYNEMATMLSNDIEAKSTYILNYLSPTNQKIFDAELLKFKDMADIDAYAYELCLKLSKQYDNIQLQIKVSNQEAWSLLDHVTPGTIIIGVTITILIIGVIYYLGSSSTDVVKTLGELQGKVNQNTLNITANANAASASIVETNTTLAGQFTAVGASMNEQVTALSNHLKIINRRLDVLEASDKTLLGMFTEQGAKFITYFKGMLGVINTAATSESKFAVEALNKVMHDLK